MHKYFDDLVRQLGEYRVAVDDAFLHGLLTGYATIPAMDSVSLFLAIAGEQPLAESVYETVFESVSSLGVALSKYNYQARFDVDSAADAKRWLDGYFKAVEIHEAHWQELNESHPEAGANLVMLHTMSNAKLHREFNMDLPGPKDLKKYPQLVTNLVLDIYHQFHVVADDTFALPDDDSSSWLDIPDEELSATDESALMTVFLLARPLSQQGGVYDRSTKTDCRKPGCALVCPLRSYRLCAGSCDGKKRRGTRRCAARCACHVLSSEGTGDLEDLLDRLMMRVPWLK